jgi:deoxyribodipyrimidine photo-lyase
VADKNIPIVVWIRRDFRLSDNPALAWASQQKQPLILVVIVNRKKQAWNPGAASDWWLHHSIEAFTESVRECGGKVELLEGNPDTELSRVIEESGADTVVWNRRYEPALIDLDKKIKKQLSARGVRVESFPGNLCHEPWQVQRNDKHPYKVFTAYWRASLKVESIELVNRVRTIRSFRKKITGSVRLAQLNLLPKLDWADNFPEYWQPGEAGAEKQLKSLIQHQLTDYQNARDLPAVDGTSRLSPHLAFGEISPRTINAAIRKALLNEKIRDDDNTEAFLREIGWREFACHLLFHFPETTDNPLDKRFEKFPWIKVDQKTFRAWQQGNTGVPLVDAGMRQLWQTGWMHNRVRMVVGSFLIKNLGYHWLEGARWFWDTLVDADLASNTMGWQWVAGSGADAAPYFRVFNPVRQGERFDKEADYVRHWVPEITGLSNKRIHCPWTADEGELREAGIVLGETYPKPIVELNTSRHAALARLEKIKQ